MEQFYARKVYTDEQLYAMEVVHADELMVDNDSVANGKITAIASLFDASRKQVSSTLIAYPVPMSSRALTEKSKPGLQWAFTKSGEKFVLREVKRNETRAKKKSAKSETSETSEMSGSEVADVHDEIHELKEMISQLTLMVHQQGKIIESLKK